MTKTLDDVMPPGGLKLDFTDMDSVELALIDLAIGMEQLEDPVIRAQARALKAMAPAWVAFLKGEYERNEDHGPGQAMFGLTRVFALLTAAGSSPHAKSAEAVTKMGEALSELFTHDVTHLAGALAKKRSVAANQWQDYVAAKH